MNKGDYVLATRWSDGDPCDPFAVGYFNGMDGDRFMVVRENGDSLGRFGRCSKISQRVGSLIVKAMPLIGDRAGRSVWFWRRNIKKLEAFIDRRHT